MQEDIELTPDSDEITPEAYLPWIWVTSPILALIALILLAIIAFVLWKIFHPSKSQPDREPPDEQVKEE